MIKIILFGISIWLGFVFNAFGADCWIELKSWDRQLSLDTLRYIFSGVFDNATDARNAMLDKCEPYEPICNGEWGNAGALVSIGYQGTCTDDWYYYMAKPPKLADHYYERYLFVYPFHGYPDGEEFDCDFGVDTDQDGIPDCSDGCPEDPEKIVPGQCGCGVPDTDSDGDTVPDCIDACPDDPDKTDPGTCGCGVPDVDTDNNGIIDCLEDGKNQGECKTCPCPEDGNPINFAIGNKHQTETDLTLDGPGLPMSYSRYYNSRSDLNGTLGYGWTGSFSEHLSIETDKIILHEADGKEVHFIDDTQGSYISEADKVRTITAVTGGYGLLEPDGKVLTFDTAGIITQITDRNGNSQIIGYTDDNLSYVEDNFGRRIDFAYNAQGRLETLTTPIGQFTYTYDTQENLASVTNPGLYTRNYLYEDTNDPNNLTGIINENGIRSGTYGYDALDRGILSEGAGGQNRVEIAYNADFVPQVTDSNGHTTDYTIQVEHGIGRIKSRTGEGCASCSSATTRFDLNDRLWLDSTTDAEGNVTEYTYDSRGNRLTKKEAAGTANERTTTYTYHPDYSLVTSITRQSIANPGQTTVTTLNYDANGNLLEQIQTGYSGTTPLSFTTTYTYNAQGQITRIDGPRTDVTDTTTFAYYPNDAAEALNRGRLEKITNALGHETTFSQYNAFGKPEESSEANGVGTTFGYDTLGRLTFRTTAGRTTTSAYDAVGNLTALTLPGGRTITYTYTDADLLEQIEDSLGNYILYTYDTEGNRIREEVHDSTGTLMKYTDFEFDPYDRLLKTLYPGDHIEGRAYDLNGNLVSVIDANTNPTTYDYDALDRLITVTQPGDAVTGYGYDSHDNLVTVTDAEGRITRYTYDDLGRVMSVDSPDSGVTSYQYDASGNLVSKTDANGITITYTYDALNRLTAITYPDTSQNITYTYDAGQNGTGRLTGITDPSGSCTYAYDALGNLVTETRTIDTIAYVTQYAYDPTGILTGITHPDGLSVTYELDSSGRVSRVTTTRDSVTRILAEDIQYLPFGPLKDFSYGNGTAMTKTFDQAYRLTGLTTGGLQSLGYTLDPVGNITHIMDNLDASKTQTFGYDSLYRLTSATGTYGAVGYTYDKVGNRLTKTLDTQTDTYVYEAGTSRLSGITGTNPRTFSLDANGNTTAVDSKTLVYNQNNRLIQATENSVPLGEYVYDANGRRVKKTADNQTTIYHYDFSGNLIGESDPAGDFLAQYVYLGAMRLGAVLPEDAQEITVHVTTGMGTDLEGVPVYAFTEAGAYTGTSATTDENGMAHFDIADFSDNTYKFRADYLSYSFWSTVITVPGTYSATIAIAEETTTVRVIRAGAPRQGVTVYLFNAGGSYLGIYGTTDENGEVRFDLPVDSDYQFRADDLGSQFWSEVITVTSGGSNTIDVDTGGGILTVTVDQGEGTPIPDINVYLFKGDGTSYLGLSDQTDTNGQAGFEVCSGAYLVRADYLGYQFWSSEITVTSDDSLLIPIPHQDVILTVQGDDAGDVEEKEDINVYLFTPAGTYLGRSGITDAQGQVTFNVPEKGYKVRADVLSRQYWSEEFLWTDKTVTIEEGIAVVTMTHMGLGIDGVNVYVFTATGTYLGLSDVTDSNGEASFRLPQGQYSFRGDYMGNQYWSSAATVIAHVENPVAISAGGGAFTLTVLKGQDEPLEGVGCYLFTDTGSYLGAHEVTSSTGEVVFNLADGNYKIRVDHLGYQFWTDVFVVPDTLTMTHTVPHQDVMITVQGDYDGDIQPREGLSVYLFTETGTYQGLNEITDAQGEVFFHVPEAAYKVRADYLGKQYWSEAVTWTDQTVTINEGMAEVQVTIGAAPVENVPVYVFTELGAYLGINGLTDETGMVSFRIPEGTYKFRADHMGSQYWATEPVTAHQVNSITVDTGGGSFALTVETQGGVPITGTPVYAFTSGGTYLGLNAQTDELGQVSFELPDGDYKFRADYLGYQFWSSVSTVPTTLSDVLTIAHQDVTVTVAGLYQAPAEPIEGVRVYLFKESGSYLGQYADTNSLGEVTFSLPEQSYKVRADYLGYQFWSDPFVWTAASVTIDHGLAVLHVVKDGADVVDAPVYLFTAAGSYLGKSEYTDADGEAGFLLPDQSYKFRVDYDGAQYWSDAVTIIPYEENSIALDLDLLALNLTNDPKPDRFDGKPPEFVPEKAVVAFCRSVFDIFAPQDVFAQAGVDSIYFFISDHLGTPQMVMDESGVVVWDADYEPFGRVGIGTEAVRNHLRFPGQYFDEETGLHYNYHRYYDPSTGRYLTPDPIGLWGGINLYTYAVNNPINKIDPLGLLYATPGAGSFHNKIEVYVQTRNVQGLKDIIALGGPLAAKAAADALNKLNENTEDEECEEDNADPLDDYPADPDEWSSPEGWEETPAGEKTGGRHRQWRGPNDELRRWDKEGRHGGQERGPHWHDPRYPGRHIDPNR